MSVKVHRSAQSFSSLVNISVQLDGVTIDRLEPGESMTFELPDHSDRLTIKAYFSKKDIAVSDGDVIEVVRNTRIMIYKILSRMLIAGLIIVTPFRIAESPYIIVALMICAVILSAYIDYFVPTFILTKTQEHDENRNMA